jgi:hypothetical protein
VRGGRWEDGESEGRSAESFRGALGIAAESPETDDRRSRTCSGKPDPAEPGNAQHIIFAGC